MSEPGQKRGRGGRREGAGRPVGSTNALRMGEVAAIKAAGLRVPESAPQPYRELADEALSTVIDVMRGAVHWQEAGPRLKAATLIRTEICGPVAQKHEVSGEDGKPLSITINRVVKR